MGKRLVAFLICATLLVVALVVGIVVAMQNTAEEVMAPQSSDSSSPQTLEPQTTMPPSSQATSPPPTQTPVIATLSTTETVYAVGDPIVFSFSISRAADDDWIGIFPASVSEDNLRGYLVWVCTCGDCYTSCTTGNVQFDDTSIGVWLLQPGSHRAFLAEW